MKVIDQDVPSDIFFRYKGSLRPSAQWINNLFGTFKFATRKFGLGSNVYVVQKRNPFRMPHMQGLGGNTPSAAQIIIRQTFRKCVDCFNRQPDSGGATPPAIGPRNRSWWYDQAGPTGLWYYDYFIQQSINSYFADIVPDWCRHKIPSGGFVQKNTPDDAFSASFNFSVDGNANYRKHSFLQWDASDFEKNLNYSLFAHLWHLNIFGDEGYTSFVWSVHEITNSWNQATLTWNNQPAIGKLLSTRTYTVYAPDYGADDYYPGIWLEFPLGKAADLPHGVRISLPENPQSRFSGFHGYNYTTPGIRCFLAPT